MGIEQYFLCFGMLLIASCLTICGFYLSSRGEIEIHPDGQIEKHGNILKAWFFYWTKEHPSKLIYHYQEDALKNVMLKMKNYLPKNLEMSIGEKGDHGFLSIVINDKFLDYKPIIEKEMGICFEYVNIGTYLLVYPIKKEPHYIYPEWIRKMMAACITCHASLYGSIIFWTFHFFCKKELLHNYFYAITNASLYWPLVFATWMAYTLSFSFLATFMYKKI